MKYPPKFCYILLTIVIFTLASGCMSEENNSNTSDNMNTPKEWDSGEGELSNQISKDGDSQSFSESSGVVNDDELLNETSYALPSGEWFVHNGEGKMNYDLSSGEMEAGEDWEARLMPEEHSSVEVNRDIRIQLKEIAQDDFEEKSSLLDETIHIDVMDDEETIMQGRLPSGKDKTYLLSLQIMGTKGLVADTLVSEIHVPAETIEASLSLDKRTYTEADDDALLEVFNESSTRITLKEAYQLEKYVADTWRIVPLELEFENTGIVVDNHGKYEQEIQLQALDTGRYRVVKQVRAAGLGEDVTLASEFSIQS